MRALALILLVGCASAKPTEADAAKATYLGEHLKCVKQHAADPEIDACREEVRQRWGKPRDAGVDQ